MVRLARSGLDVLEIKIREGRLVVVFQVVQADRLGEGRGYRYDCRGWIVGYEVGRGEVQLPLGVGRADIPELDGVV